MNILRYLRPTHDHPATAGHRVWVNTVDGFGNVIVTGAPGSGGTFAAQYLAGTAAENSPNLNIVAYAHKLETMNHPLLLQHATRVQEWCSRMPVDEMRDRISQVQPGTEDRPLLLLIDNFEHLTGDFDPEGDQTPGWVRHLRMLGEDRHTCLLIRCTSMRQCGRWLPDASTVLLLGSADAASTRAAIGFDADDLARLAGDHRPSRGRGWAVDRRQGVLRWLQIPPA